LLIQFRFVMKNLKQPNKHIIRGDNLMKTLNERIKASLGERKVDLIIKNGRVINVFTCEIEKKDVAIFNGFVVGFGEYDTKEIIDIKGDYLCPGLIDGHVHIESSMLTPPQFARAVLPHGTTTVVIDPHEIANVMGIKGIKFMAESSKKIPLNVFIMLPSCVPATFMETSGAKLNSEKLKPLLKEDWVLGLGEMMNYPGVIHRDPEVLKKIEMVNSKRIDGHAPGLSGKSLYGYLMAGIQSDHECTQTKEAVEKLRNGMWIMIREGSTAKNLKALIPIVNQKNSRRFFFVTDDRHPKELIEKGHIDSMVKTALKMGLDPLLAIQMATINPAEYFRLDNIGAIAPGYRADIISIENLHSFRIKKVFKDGILISENGKILNDQYFKLPKRIIETKSIRISSISKESLTIRSNQHFAKVIKIIPDQIITKKVIKRIILKNGIAYPDLKEDILKIAVIERHRATGNIGVGFVQGFGLKSGAIGTSIAHDSHNIILVGTNDEDMLKALETISKMGGGLVVVSGQKVLASLPLPIAGLMTDLSITEVQRKIDTLQKASRDLGCKISDPFMTLSFLSLPVIPELKLTDRGLVDVNQFKIVPLFGK